MHNQLNLFNVATGFPEDPNVDYSAPTADPLGDSNEEEESLLGDWLVWSVKRVLEIAPEYRETMSVAAWRNEFGTLSIKTCRRSGKTKAILRLAERFTTKMTIVTKSHQSTYGLRRAMEDAGIHVDARPDVIDSNVHSSHYGAFHAPEVLVLDELAELPNTMNIPPSVNVVVSLYT